MRALAAGLRELAGRPAAGVLCAVVATQGSTYRKPGALILLDAHGACVGALSGGCLEAELERLARDVLASGVAAQARFDTSGDEDRVFGTGTGCGGSTRTLLLPLPCDRSPLRDALLDADDRCAPLALRLATGADRLGCGEARVAPPRDETRCYRFDRRGDAAPGDAPLEATVDLSIRAPLHLLLLGAGPETRSLLQLTRLLGWRVELVEHRERWVRFADGCGIDRAHRARGTDWPALLDAARFDAALVMNHNFDLDARALRALAGSDIRYVGLLGPARRRDELLAEVGAEAATRLSARLRAPVGLPLGGEGAEAIALAIVAQLQNDVAHDARA
jgi:xanthine dehydrogenase accessory factor